MGCPSDLALVKLNREFLLNVEEGVKRDALCVFFANKCSWDDKMGKK